MISAAPRGETPAHNVRVPASRWREASQAAKALGTNRERMINDLLQWGIENPAELARVLGRDGAAPPE